VREIPGLRPPPHPTQTPKMQGLFCNQFWQSPPCSVNCPTISGLSTQIHPLDQQNQDAIPGQADLIIILLPSNWWFTARLRTNDIIPTLS
jgi:hypothetical protein